MMTFGTEEDRAKTPTGGFDFMLGSSGAPGTPARGLDLAERPRRNRRRRGGLDTGAVVRTVVVVALALVVVGVAGFTGYTLVQDAEAKVTADSGAFCADLATTPGVLTEAGFGWPNDSSAGIPASLDSMRTYQARWDNLATVGPPTIRPDLAAIATTAATITANVEATNTIDRAGNLATIEKVTSQTALRAWAKKYCS